MSDLSELRIKIDALDTEILRLLNERAAVAKEIGVIKNRASLAIYSPDREMKLLRSLEERSNGPLKPVSIRAIYREIMSAALALEKDIVIACPGPSGSPAHQAALAKFGSSVRYETTPDTATAFDLVASGQSDCGVVPLETPGHGFQSATLDALVGSPLLICAEIPASADHQSRFLVVGRHPSAPTGSDRTMIMLEIENKPGALVSALEPFRKLDVNLHHFASRPADPDSKSTWFFMEADGHTSDLEQKGLYTELEKNCRSVKPIGSYPKPRIP
jgi:chorismate mutase-like protein